MAEPNYLQEIINRIKVPVGQREAAAGTGQQVLVRERRATFGWRWLEGRCYHRALCGLSDDDVPRKHRSPDACRDRTWVRPISMMQPLLRVRILS